MFIVHSMLDMIVMSRFPALLAVTCRATRRQIQCATRCLYMPMSDRTGPRMITQTIETEFIEKARLTVGKNGMRFDMAYAVNIAFVQSWI